VVGKGGPWRPSNGTYFATGRGQTMARTMCSRPVRWTPMKEIQGR